MKTRVLAAVVTALWIALPATGQAEPVTLRFGQIPSTARSMSSVYLFVAQQKGLLARQTREIYLLKNDATYLETIARDRLDLMKEGETIFRLETPQAGKEKR